MRKRRDDDKLWKGTAECLLESINQGEDKHFIHPAYASLSSPFYNNQTADEKQPVKPQEMRGGRLGWLWWVSAVQAGVGGVRGGG